MSPWTLLALMPLFIALEGFFSGSEIAVVSADRQRLRARAEEGHRGARHVLAMLDRPSYLLGTCLVGTNISVVATTTLSTLALVRLWPDYGDAAAVVLAVPLVLVLGELVPKSVYQHHADRIAPVVIYPLRFFSWAFSPALIVLEFLERLLVGDAPAGVVSREDILRLLRGGGHVAIDKEDKALIRRVFAFTEARVEEAMVPLIDVVMLEESAPARAAIATMNEHGHSRLPIYQQRVDAVTGVVHTADLLHLVDLDTPVRDVMRTPKFVPESKRVEELFLEFRRERKHLAMAVDEYGGAVGLVTREDLLEEIVGDISDESDRRQPGIRSVADGEWVVSARLEKEPLEEKLGFHLPDGDYETLAGFLLSRLGRVPKVDEVVELPSWRLTIVKANDRAILEVRLSRKRRQR